MEDTQMKFSSGSTTKGRIIRKLSNLKGLFSVAENMIQARSKLALQDVVVGALRSTPSCKN
jgi:hypothetical protein